MIRQFVPQEACLKCQGCCRFRVQDSVWSPCLMDEDIQVLLDHKIPPATLSLDKKIVPVPNQQGEGYLCAFLDAPTNKCLVYGFRPFECQLYPFLLSLRQKRVYLTIDLNCPYAKEKLNSQEFKDYVEYLSDFLNAPAQVELLKENPHLLAAYEDVLDVIELNPPDEA
ncbi:MAG: YkgJ family cysteine cluster protein [Candidatus Omnitrophica bacterium]|nr:YkgJ family cysteine cluster protein [Candidatus Omnitrophota bacterium]